MTDWAEVSVKRLPSQRSLVLSKIKVSKKQRVKRDPTKRVIADRRVPSSLRTSVDTGVQSSEDRFELISKQLSVCIEHGRQSYQRHYFDNAFMDRQSVFCSGTNRT